MTHGFKLEALPSPVCFPTRDAGPSLQWGFCFSFPRPCFPSHSLPGPLAGGLLLSPVPANLPPSPLPGPAVSCLTLHDVHLAARTPNQTASCCFQTLPSDTGDGQPCPVPHTLQALSTGPLVHFVGAVSTSGPEELRVSLELAKNTEGSLLPIRAEVLDSQRHGFK